jgi:hypothetical protein
MTLVRIASVAFVCVLAGCASSSTEQAITASIDAGKSSPATIDRITKLEGDWYRIGADGNATDELVSRFKTTAADTTVIETMFPGTETEMVTAYHQDGPTLILQHYCSHGNQPRMAATPASTPDQYVFDFVSGTNMALNDPHVHAITLTFESEDVLKVDVVHWSGGVADENASWRLKRKRG